MSVLRWIIVGVVLYFVVDYYDPNIIPKRNQLMGYAFEIQRFASLVFQDVRASITPIVQFEYFSLIPKNR